MKIEGWINLQLEKLELNTSNFTGQEKSKIGYNYLKKAIEIIPGKISVDLELKEFKSKIEMIFDSIPEKKEGEKITFENYSSALSVFKKTIKKKYNLVEKGTYLSQWIPLGLALGLPWGFVFGSLIYGLPIGILLGLIIGSILENKAKKENRILN